MVMNNVSHQFRLILLVIVSLLLSMPSFAQVYATVSKNRVTQNELFRLTIVADSKVSSDLLDLSSLESDFETLGRPSFGTSINIINGKRSTRSEWNINIAANRTGIITIPTLHIGSEQTQPIALQVVSDSAAPNNQDLVEINTHFDDTTLYPNQSTVMHVELIIKADTRRLQNPQITPPSTKGIQLESASEPNQSQQIINGIQSTIVTQDFRITGLTPGSFDIIEPQFESQLIYEGYNGATQMLALKTKAKSYPITVLEKPNQYTGVWLPTSYLNLEQQWQDDSGNQLLDDITKVNVGDPITRQIKLTVRGVSQEQIPNLTVNYPDSLRVYGEKPSYQTLDNGDLVMTMKQVLIPNTSGDISIPGITLKWWDTKVKAERKSLLASKVIRVSPQTQSDITPLPTPTQAPQTSVVHVDNGIWPYLTALFAFLWVATLIWMNRNGLTRSNAAASDPVPQDDDFKQLNQAIHQNDGFKVNVLIQRWLDESTLSVADKQSVIEAKQTWLAQQYASQTPEADNKVVFLSLLTQLKKKARKKNQQTNEPLAKL
ncbi:BatD family protein [Vibrio sp. RC27]